MEAHQAPPSLGFSRHEHWSGCHFLLQCMKVKVKGKSLSCVRFLATPWTAAYQAPPSMGFSSQEYWSGVPLPFMAQILLIYKLWKAYLKVNVLVAQLCPTLCDPMDCSLPGCSCPWDFPGKNTGVGCHSLCKGPFQLRDQTHVSCIAGRFFTIWTLSLIYKL